MAMTDLLRNYLLENQVLKIPGFGTFFLKDAPAFLDEKSGAILPPGKEILFEVDFELKDSAIVNYLAINQNKPASEISIKLNETTAYWKNTLDAKHELEISEFGSFFTNDNHLSFKGKHFSAESPENFGLEKLDISELNNRKPQIQNTSAQDYKASRNPFWWLLLIIPVTAIVYFATQNPELIFGKKSFKNLKKSSEKPISNSKNIKNDSIKMDSLKTKTLPSKIK